MVSKCHTNKVDFNQPSHFYMFLNLQYLHPAQRHHAKCPPSVVRHVEVPVSKYYNKQNVQVATVVLFSFSHLLRQSCLPKHNYRFQYPIHPLQCIPRLVHTFAVITMPITARPTAPINAALLDMARNVVK